MPNPLPIKNGLNATRVQMPVDWEGSRVAADFVWHLVNTQRHRHPEDDRTAVLARFAAGEVVTDRGEVVTADDVLPLGAWINFYRRPAPEREVPGELRVLHQDENLVVVDKPPFLATLPRGQHIAQTALTRARVELGMPELVPCHRLDRLTSGVLMMSARREVRAPYQTMFDRRLPQKTYTAITPIPEGWAGFPDHPLEALAVDGAAVVGTGVPLEGGRFPVFSPLPAFAGWCSWTAPTPERPWLLEQRLVKIQGRLTAFVDEGLPNAQTLVVGCSVIQKDGVGLLRWTLLPRSGRTHQLRIVMRSLGLPLVNDSLYGFVDDYALTHPDGVLPAPAFVEDEDFGAPLGLIAQRLEFDDPLSGVRRSFESSFGWPL